VGQWRSNYQRSLNQITGVFQFGAGNGAALPRHSPCGASKTCPPCCERRSSGLHCLPNEQRSSCPITEQRLSPSRRKLNANLARSSQTPLARGPVRTAWTAARARVQRSASPSQYSNSLALPRSASQLQSGLAQPFELVRKTISTFHRGLIAFSLMDSLLSVHKICGWAVSNVVNQCSMVRRPALCSNLPKFWAAKASTF